jgi:hypothetical protein
MRRNNQSNSTLEYVGGETTISAYAKRCGSLSVYNRPVERYPVCLIHFTLIIASEMGMCDLRLPPSLRLRRFSLSFLIDLSLSLSLSLALSAFSSSRFDE